MAECDSEFENIVKLKLCTVEQCKNNIGEIYSKIIKFLDSDKSIFDKTEVLGILFSIVVQCIQPEYLLKDFNTISDCMESLLESSLKADLSNLSSVTSLLDNAIQLIEYLTAFIKHSISSQQYQLDYVIAGLAVIKKSYLHCSKCSEFYGDFLDHIKDRLQKLITQSHGLQVQVLTYLDNIQVNDSKTLENNTELLISILDKLFDLLPPLTETMEVKATIPIWKAYAKIMFHFEDVLTGVHARHWDISSMLKYLCSEIIRLINGEMISAPLKEASGHLKICSFLFKLVISSCGKFSGQIKNCFGNVLELSLTLLKVSPPNLSSKMESGFADEYRRMLLVGLNPLVEHLIGERKFVTTILTLEPNNDNALALCLFYVIVLDILPSSDTSALEISFSGSEYTIVARLFQSIQLCPTECLLPIYLDGVMCQGKPQHSVSLFHFVCVHLCGFISSLPTKFFQKAETSLFSYALDINPFTALLSSDIFCFIARFSTSELCFVHCCTFAKILTTLEYSVTSMNASSLLRRLFTFLGPAHQRQLLSEFPSTYFANLLDAHHLHPSSSLICDNEWKNFENLAGSLQILEVKAKTHQIISKDEMMMILKVAGAISSLPRRSALTELVLNKLSRILLVVNDIENEAATCLAECFRVCASQGVESAYLVLDALFQNQIKKPLSNESVQLLSQCLAIGLNSSNALLQEMAFERLAVISHPILNVELIRQTIKLCSQNISFSFKEYMKAFISSNETQPNKLDFVKYISKPQNMVEKMECGVSFNLFGTNFDDELRKNVLPENEVNPPAKRPKHSLQISKALYSLSEAVRELQEACVDCQMELSTSEEIKNVIRKLNKLL